MNELDAHVENHAPGEGDPRTDSIFYIGIIGVILTAATAIALAGLHYSGANDEFERKAANVVFDDTVTLAAKQHAVLYQPYQWLDRANNTIAIPINRAMELTITDLNKAKGEHKPAGDAGK